ncbi:MAG: 4Fe-4S binding protein [Spirochaetota bacterium]
MRFQRTVQVLSLLVFVLLLFFAAELAARNIPADIFLRLSPFIALSVMIAGRMIIPGLFVSLILLGVSLVFGRFFCAYLCPFGTTIDCLDWLAISRVKRRPVKHPDQLRKSKYYILAFLAVSSLFSLILIHAFDPIALSTRIYTFLVYPLGVSAVNLALDIFRPLASRLNWVKLSVTRFPPIVFTANLATFLILAAIVALNVFQTRFWCRNLCPLGALLSLVSRFGFLKRKVGEGCTDCFQCRNQCPMSAIEEDPRRTRIEECIQCRHCVRVCPEKVVSFRPVSPFKKRETVYTAQTHLSRRVFLLSAVSATATGFIAYSHPSRLLRNPDLIRPPGSIPEEEFLDTCIRCGSCMRVCITNTLQPCSVETEVRSLWSPRLVQRLAACEATCNRCGQVCPTQAIRRLPLEEKIMAKIGTAYIDRRRCLAWEQDRLCLICDEQCPYDAIELIDFEGLKRPIVYEHKCSGCGMCESKCPVEGRSAIVVLPIGEVRLKEDSYIQEAGRLNLDLKLVEKTPFPGAIKIQALSLEDLGLEPDNLPPLPPGFITDQELEMMERKKDQEKAR